MPLVTSLPLDIEPLTAALWARPSSQFLIQELNLIIFLLFLLLLFDDIFLIWRITAISEYFEAYLFDTQIERM